MSDDTKHPDQHHIPTPAEVRAEHPTVLVPAHPDDEVRRIESHDGEHPAEADADTAPDAVPAATPVPGPVPAPAPAPAAAPVPAHAAAPAPAVEVVPAPVPAPRSGPDDDTDELAQVIAATAEVVPGVHALGSTPARILDSARTRLLGRTGVPGVSVLAADEVLSVDVELVAEYPANVAEVADTVRGDVADMLEGRHAGPVDIDITVTDIHGPFDPIESEPGEADEAAEPDAVEPETADTPEAEVPESAAPETPVPAPDAAAAQDTDAAAVEDTDAAAAKEE